MNITPPTNGQPVVDDAHVGNRRMHVKIRRGLLQGETNVCPAIDDWDVEMLNEDREHLGDDLSRQVPGSVVKLQTFFLSFHPALRKDNPI